ncbi:type II toxin-antitoxin system HipA family toxin [Undibacterium danionis]|uniref:Type II toxin-antitoxin system HipA family toxin n=1 Tax=Undibacterium danionis TaxID=1812100 RepID=A0ABV6IEZ1_9BURK
MVLTQNSRNARKARNRGSLNVWLNGIPVGQWTNTANNSTFTYFEQWLAHEQGRPLSLSMPFRADNATYSGEVVTNYFDNLLPDSEPIRRRLVQRHQVGGTSPFELLSAIGRDCVGATQLLPVDQVPDDLFSITGEPLNEQRIAQLLRSTTTPTEGLARSDANPDLRLSIAGAQEKTALLWHQDQWLLPQGSTPTTHILKLPLGLVGAMQADFRTSVENEWLCAQIIELFGLPIARTAVLQFEDQKVLGVERFDRKFSDDGTWIARLPQEDMCQVVGCSPLEKYQREGGPGIVRIMQILLGSEAAEVDRYHFFKTQLIFWLLMATDGHAKNFSIALLPRGRYRATPLYDVLSAHPIVGTGKNKIQQRNAKLAMAVRGSTNYYDIYRIQRRHWSTMAQQVNLGAQAAERIIEELIVQTPRVVRDAYRLVPAWFPQDLADSILQGILRQLKKLQGQSAEK